MSKKNVTAKKNKKAEKAKKAEAAEKSRIWNAFSLVAAMLAASVARKTLTVAWQSATGKQPPNHPADPDVEFREALLWAAVSGTLVAVARMLATRRAAQYYARSTGQLPPGVRAEPAPLPA